MHLKESESIPYEVEDKWYEISPFLSKSHLFRIGGHAPRVLDIHSSKDSLNKNNDKYLRTCAYKTWIIKI